MKYAILDQNGNQIEWHNVAWMKTKQLPANAVELTDIEWDNRQAPTAVQLLVNAKNQALTTLEFNRITYQYQNLTVGGVTYAGSETAANNLVAAISIMQDSSLSTVNWLDVNNNTISLTLAQAIALKLAMFQQQSYAYFAESAIIAKINACTTVAQVQAITLNF